MRIRSTPFALFLALLVVLWQPLCLCAEDGVGGHSHGGAAHAIEESGDHHGNETPVSHDAAQGDHEDHGKGVPCDDHGSGCDCSKLIANTKNSGQSGRAGLEGLTQAALAQTPLTFLEPPLLPHHGLRGLAPGGLPPPPLLKLYRVLLI